MDGEFGLGHVQRGWRRTDEDITHPFIRALRRGHYEEALRIAPTPAAMAEWPPAKRADWTAWTELARRMKGQREHDLAERGRGRPL